jgi:hypothetical protein
MIQRPALEPIGAKKHSSPPLSLDEEPLPGLDRHGAEIADGTADFALRLILAHGLFERLRPQVVPAVA